MNSRKKRSHVIQHKRHEHALAAAKSEKKTIAKYKLMVLDMCAVCVVAKVDFM